MKNTLEENLELRKALAEVDRLTAENLDLKQQDHVWESEWQEQREKIDELEDKFRKLRLGITNQIYFFETNQIGAYEMVRIIKEILDYGKRI